MNVPQPLETTARLMAGYTFVDGSIVELGDTGGRGEHDHKIMRYLITDAAGAVIADGSDLEASPLAQDYGAIMSDLLMFLQHDAEMYEYSPAGSWGKRYPNIAQAVGPEDFAFGERVAAWAVEHAGEPGELAATLGTGKTDV